MWERCMYLSAIHNGSMDAWVGCGNEGQGLSGLFDPQPYTATVKMRKHIDVHRAEQNV